MPKVQESELHVLGVPLQENKRFSPELRERIATLDILVGESPGVMGRWLRQEGLEVPTVYALDRPQELQHALRDLANRKGKAVKVGLLSDTGMPILADPGGEILQFAREQGFAIRCVPGPTSWGTACALAGYPAPYTFWGFPPRKTEDRRPFFQQLARHPFSSVLLETPYRYRKLLEELQGIGKNRECFLAWEIGGNEEQYFWGKLQELIRWSQHHRLEKGEFVLILRAP